MGIAQPYRCATQTLRIPLSLLKDRSNQGTTVVGKSQTTLLQVWLVALLFFYAASAKS